jgi:glycosyltransferase involved in cell wall biosynthesis
MSSKLNILSLTAGEALLEKRPDGTFNQQQLRQLEYAKHLGRYAIITRTLRREHMEPVTLAPNLTVYPSNSFNRMTFIRDAIRMTERILDETSFDAVSPRDPFWFGRIGMKISRKHNIPLAVHVMADMIDNPYFVRERFGNSVLNRWAKRILAAASAIRVSTHRERENLVRLGYPENKIFRVPFFVDLAPFLRSRGGSERTRLLDGGFDSIVLTVARLSRQKDFPTLLRAAQRVVLRRGSVRFVIVGDGNEMENMTRMISSLGLERNVLLTGKIDNQELPDIYGAADVFAISSFYEGTCMVLLEAAASGLPIVSTDMAGARDAIVPDETGYIVPIGDDAVLAERILTLLDDKMRTHEMGERGRRYVVERFDKEKIVSDLIAFWDYAAKKHG